MAENQIFEYLYLATTRCNCRCKHCVPKVYTGKPFELTSGQMIEQYEKSSYLKRNSVSVAGGEPFVKEDVIEFIEYLDQKRIPTVVSTNGWFTDRVEKLLDCLSTDSSVRFAISIDGPEQMHDEIRKVKGIFQNAVNTAVLIKERGFNVQINTVIQKDNLENLEDFDSFFKCKGIPVIYIPQIFVGEEKFDFSLDDIRKILKYANYPRAKKYLLSKGSWKISNCHAAKNSWVIDCNGDVYACWGGYYKDNSDDYIIGNISERSFDEVFESDRKSHVYENVVKKCSGCLLPRDIERENEHFGYSARLTFEEVEILADDLGNKTVLDDYAIDSDDWYPTEHFEGENFRWMKKAKSVMYVRIERKSRKIVLDIINARSENYKFTVNLKGCCNTASIEGIDSGVGRNNISIPIPDDFTDVGLIEIDLEIDRLWSPKDYNKYSTDERMLGLGVFSAEVI